MKTIELHVVVQGRGTTTVKELKRALATLSSEFDHYAVYTEGCDCTGDCHSIIVDEDDKSIELRRG